MILGKFPRENRSIILVIFLPLVLEQHYASKFLYCALVSYLTVLSVILVLKQFR